MRRRRSRDGDDEDVGLEPIFLFRDRLLRLAIGFEPVFSANSTVI